MLQALSKDCKLVKVCGAQVAGKNDTITVAEIDMDGFSDVCVVLSLGAVVDTADITFKLQEYPTTGGDGGTYTDIAGAANSATNMTNAAHTNKALVIDCKKVSKRFLNVNIARSNDANITIENCWAILYNGRVLPVTQGTAVKSAVLAN